MVAPIVIAVAVLAQANGNPFESDAPLQPANRIDELVFAKLDQLNIPPSKLCSDAVFLRRVYIDMTGTLPRAHEARRFLKSKDPQKRRRLIEELFKREAFADYWAFRWCDILKVKSEFPSKLWPNAVQAYHRWIRTALVDNMPYDDFARALLTSSGSNFRVPPVNFYRAVSKKEPREILDAVALIFMGMRTKHWSDEQRNGMAAFFGKVGYKSTMEWKEEIVYFDFANDFLNPETGKPYTPKLLDGNSVAVAKDEDPRQVFADWLISEDKQRFARNAVNRVWFWLLGRGIVHEPDDMRPDNPPQNPELLDYLASELIAHDYDMRHIYRMILNSTTYQLSAISNERNKNDISNFSHAHCRQLDAEVLIDAICQISGPREQYWSKIPEPFTFLPRQERSINVADGSISSSFLEMFGRPSRATGYLCERKNMPSAFQQLHLLNSSHIRDKIGKGWRLRKTLKRANKNKKTVDNIYLTILSRFPSERERLTLNDHAAKSSLGKRDIALDLVWALFNSKEFITRH